MRYYVDDLFLAFNNPNDMESIHQKFNSIHPNLKFTKEKENDKKLPFFDFVIIKTSNGIETTYIKSQHFQGYISNATATLRPNIKAVYCNKQFVASGSSNLQFFHNASSTI